MLTFQVPWIMTGTVKDNILFGHPFDASFFWEVVDACSLQPDFEQLAAAEMTELGERGVNLSGGKRAICVTDCHLQTFAGRHNLQLVLWLC